MKLNAIFSAAPETSRMRPIITPRPMTIPMLPRVLPKPLLMALMVSVALRPPQIPAMDAAISMAMKACTRVRNTR